MLIGYRLLIAATCGLILFVALGTGAFFGSLYGPDRKHYETEAGKQRGQSDYTGPSQSMPDIAGLPGPVERAIANPHPATGQDHEKRGLAAQEASALWAFWMFGASFASVVITVVGTILLYRQIVLTRKAVVETGKATQAMQDANRITANTQRPWINISAELLSFSINGRVMTAEFRIEFKNTGHMVAENFYPRVKVVQCGHDFLVVQKDFFDKFERDPQNRDVVVIPGRSYDYIVHSSEGFSHFPWCMTPGYRKDCHYMLIAMCSYNIPGDNTLRVAHSVFSLGEDLGHIDNRNLIAESLPSLTSDRVKLLQFGRSRAT